MNNNCLLYISFLATIAVVVFSATSIYLISNNQARLNKILKVLDLQEEDKSVETKGHSLSSDKPCLKSISHKEEYNAYVYSKNERKLNSYFFSDYNIVLNGLYKSKEKNNNPFFDEYDIVVVLDCKEGRVKKEDVYINFASWISTESDKDLILSKGRVSSINSTQKAKRFFENYEYTGKRIHSFLGE